MSAQAQVGVLALRLLALAVFLYLVRNQILFLAIGAIFVVLTVWQMVRAVKWGRTRDTSES